jgi:outer membrane biosynthesis protein TonB
MRVEFQIGSGKQARAFARFATEYADILDAERREYDRQYGIDPFEAPAAPAVDPAQTELPLDAVAPQPEPEVKKERKPRAKKEKPAVDVEPIAVDAPVQAEVVVDTGVDVDLPAPTPEPAPAPVVAPAGPKAEDLANQTRDLAKVNFAGVKAVLAKFGVARFGELKPDQYPAYASALAAL